MAQPKDTVWSISKWNDWKACPAMYHAKHITKLWKDFPSPQMDRGRQLHSAMEEAIKYDVSLPDELAAFAPMVKAFREMKEDGAMVEPELKLGLSVHYKRVDFFRGERLRIRAAFDLYVEDDRKALVIDYKSGRPKTEHRQEAAFYGACAGVGMGPTAVQVMYVYLDQPESTFTVDVKDPSRELSDWNKRFSTADAAIIGGCFDLIPGNACKWCGAFQCPQNKNPKLGN